MELLMPPTQLDLVQRCRALESVLTALIEELAERDPDLGDRVAARLAETVRPAALPSGAAGATARTHFRIAIALLLGRKPDV